MPVPSAIRPITNIILHRPIARIVDRVVRSDKDGEADLCPMKVTLGEVVEGGECAIRALTDLSPAMAESRELELRITDRMVQRTVAPIDPQAT